MSLCAFTELFEIILWRHDDVIMTSSKFKNRITKEPYKMQAIATGHMKPCHFVRLLGCLKNFGDVMMTSLWRHQNLKVEYRENHARCRLLRRDIWNLVTLWVYWVVWKKICDVIMTSLWRHQNLKVEYRKNHVRCKLLWRHIWNLVTLCVYWAVRNNCVTLWWRHNDVIKIYKSNYQRTM